MGRAISAPVWLAKGRFTSSARRTCASGGLRHDRSFRGAVMRIKEYLVISLLAGAAVGASAQTMPLDQAARAFGAREAVQSPVLSPDGLKVLYLTPAVSKRTTAVIGDLESGVFTSVVSSDGDPETLDWCNFVSMARLVCNFSGHIKNASDGDLIGFTRLVALDSDGSNPKLLGQAASVYDAKIRQNDGDIIDWLSDSEGSVLMSRLYVPEEGKIGSLVVSKKSGVGVDRINVANLRRDAVEAPREAAEYMSDGRGSVRLMSIMDSRNSGMLTGNIQHLYRTKGTKSWKSLPVGKDEEFTPLAIDDGIDSLYALKKKDGRSALYTVKLDGSLTQTLVAENARVDIDDVVRFGEGQQVIGYTYNEEQRKTVYFSPEFRALAASLSKALPNLPLVNFVSSSKDGNRLLIVAASDSNPGRYYVFDRARKSLNEAMYVRPELNGANLASVKPVQIQAPDGAKIPAYLTLPPGKEAKGLPAIVLPHGGPSARDVWGFDWLAQFLAARGYAVLQPNYRGSAGYGDAWRNQNGFKNWRVSIGDITASARWLAAEGIANPERVAIVRASYGGYAALQSAVTEPSVYKAVVAIAPVTDLGLLKQDSRNFTDADLVAREVGSGPHVAEGSPLRHAATISAPVLLLHGDMDANVRISHSQKMQDALRAAGKQSELVTFKGIDHYFEDATVRSEMLIKIGQILDRTIGKQGQ